MFFSVPTSASDRISSILPLRSLEIALISPKISSITARFPRPSPSPCTNSDNRSLKKSSLSPPSWVQDFVVLPIKSLQHVHSPYGPYFPACLLHEFQSRYFKIFIPPCTASAYNH